MGRGTAIVAAVGVLVGVSSLWTPLVPNFGIPFGYFGKLNRVLSYLRSCPAVTVLDVGQHQDLTLEDFWVTVRLPDGSTAELDFSNANIRPFSELRTVLEQLPCE
jgi:hypothetical protein